MRLIGRLEPAKEKNQSQQHKPTNCHRIRKYTVCAARIWLVRSLCLFDSPIRKPSKNEISDGFGAGVENGTHEMCRFSTDESFQKRYGRKLLPSGKQSRDKMDGRQWGWYLCSWYYCNGCPGSAPCFLLCAKPSKSISSQVAAFVRAGPVFLMTSQRNHSASLPCRHSRQRTIGQVPAREKMAQASS